MRKRGQAALEFLMTYGWAILVVLVVIGALAYFGVLNPSILLPEKCNMGPGVTCKDWLVSSGTGGTVDFSFENGIGTGIIVQSISLVGAGNTHFSGTAPPGTYAGGCIVDLTPIGAAAPPSGCVGATSDEADLTECRDTEGWYIPNAVTGTVKVTCNTITGYTGKSKLIFELVYYKDDSSSAFARPMQGELLTAAA